MNNVAYTNNKQFHKNTDVFWKNMIDEMEIKMEKI